MSEHVSSLNLVVSHICFGSLQGSVSASAEMQLYEMC